MPETYDAMAHVANAAKNWCDYLEENDREDEIPQIEDAIKELREAFKQTGKLRAAAGVLPPPSAVNPGGSQPSVFRTLDLSTKHLSFEVCQDLNGFPGVLADERSEYGWFVWVPEDIDKQIAEVDAEDPEHPIPAEVVAVWRYAAQHDCQYVLFDRDARVNPDLPTWEW